MQLKDQLLEVIGEQLQQPSNLTFESEPLPRLAQRCAEMETSCTAVDPCPWLLEAHAELTQRLEAEEGGGSSTGTVAATRAYAALHEYCSTSLLLEATALADPRQQQQPPPLQREGNSPAQSAPDARLGVLHRFDLQIQLRLGLAAVGVAAGARNEPDKGKAYAELKRMLQLFGIKLSAAWAAARGGDDGDEDDEQMNGTGEAIEPPPLQQQGVESSTAATAQTTAATTTILANSSASAPRGRTAARLLPAGAASMTT